MVSLDRAEQLEKQEQQEKEFEKWKTNFEDSAGGTEALDELIGGFKKFKIAKNASAAQIKAFNESICSFEEMVLWECFLASTYDESRDKPAERRKELVRVLRDDVDSQLKVVKKALKFMEKYPEIHDATFKLDEEPSLASLAGLLEKYNQALPKAKDLLVKEKVPNNHRVGNLLYSETFLINLRKPRNIQMTGLIFSLSKLFRECDLEWPDSEAKQPVDSGCYDNTDSTKLEEVGLGDPGVLNGIKMGGPDNKYIALFTNATFQLSTPGLSPNQVKARVTRLEKADISLVPWPHEVVVYIPMKEYYTIS
ncbi:MAG: hypothetical protein ACI9UO_001603 [Nitrospinales bacterium]|jgi:hypothetical protein